MDQGFKIDVAIACIVISHHILYVNVIFWHFRSKRPWKKTKKRKKYSGSEKLLIPLPLPHPCHIAIIIYNRENDEPILMESEACQNVLKAIEESTSVSLFENEYINVDMASVDSQSQGSVLFNEGENEYVSRSAPPKVGASRKRPRSQLCQFSDFCIIPVTYGSGNQLILVDNCFTKCF